ncbi:MAG: SocA family protein [Chlorobaculum sp.]|jgi:uncharacterized phage-associated protein|nr:SocA family protein [Chlorobaculum sp.]
MENMNNWFNARKAAQVAAFFALKEGGDINVLKLTKLVYLADRRHMELYDYPILDDELVSMPHGPVNSMTYNFINGYHEDAGWNKFISDRTEHKVGLTSSISLEQLDELSKAELDTLDQIWQKFGAMEPFQLRDWTHENCPEWEDPHGSSNPIPYERVFKYLGKKNAEELENEIRENRVLASSFSH